MNTLNEALGSNNVIVTQTLGLTATAALNISAINPCTRPSAPGSSGLRSGRHGGGSVVNLTDTTLNGHAQNTTGALNKVTVTDTRGTNVGWVLNGQLNGDFLNGTPGLDNGNPNGPSGANGTHNTIAASNLWSK